MGRSRMEDRSEWWIRRAGARLFLRIHREGQSEGVVMSLTGHRAYLAVAMLSILAVAVGVSPTEALRASGDASGHASGHGVIAAAAPDRIRAPRLVAADDLKTAVVATADDRAGESFTVADGSGAVALTGTLAHLSGDAAPWPHAALADFSTLTTPGTYTVRVGELHSASIVVAVQPYRGLLLSLLGVYDANSDGHEASTYHRPSHLHDASSPIINGPSRGHRIDVAGGWMDSGDQLKFTSTIGYATTMLELAARNEPGSAARIRKVADTGVRWLLKAHPKMGLFAAQVGDTNGDHNQGFRDPTEDDDSSNSLLSHRPTEVLTAKTGGTDVAAITSAALALAAQRTPAGGRRIRLVQASKSWLAEARTLNRPWKNCCYQQDSIRDDLAAAEVELWRATRKNGYATAALRDLKAVAGAARNDWRVQFDGYEMAGLPAAELCGVLGRPGVGDPASRTGACRILRAGGRHVMHLVGRNAFGLGGDLQFGTVREDMSGSLVALLAGKSGLPGATAAGSRARDWFLGVNPWGVRFQAGFGVVHPYHWSQLQGPNLPLGAVPGGPASVATINANSDTDLEPGPFDTEQAAYRDVEFDYVTNEVGIPYNAGPVLVMALLSPK